MPNIPGFSAPSNLGLQPTEIGVDAQAAAARRINSAYNQAGQGIENTGQRLGSAIGGAIAEGGKIAVDQMDHEQISHGAKAGSELLLQKEQEWNDTAKKADPNDPSVAGQFREESLEPALEQFAAGFTTEKSQAWAERFVDQVRQHMANKTTADMSRAAGVAVHTNTVMAANNFATAAYNDPSSLAISRDAFNHSLEGIVGSSPTLTADDAAAVRTKVGFDGNKQIVRAAIAGAVSRGGDWQKIANDPKNAGFVDATEIAQFVKADQTYRRMEQEGARAAAADQRRQATAGFHRDANQWELSTLDENGNATLPPDAVQKLKDMTSKYGENAEPGRVTAMVHRVQELGKILDPASAANQKKTSDTNERQLYTQMALPAAGAEPMTEDKINAAYSKGDIQFAARNRLLKDFQDDKSPAGQTLANSRTEFFRNYAATIDPGRDQATGAGASALGSQKIGEAQQEARRQEGVLRAQGKDPHSLYDPNSPDFFGKQVSRFRATLAEKAAYDAQVKADQSAKPAAPAPATTPAGPKLGERQQFKQGWGVWNGTAWVPEK